MFKRRLKYLIFLMVTVLLLQGSVLMIYAADADANAANNSYVNNNGVRIFPLGCRSRWSGFIVYIIDGDTNLKSDVKVVLSQTTEPDYNDDGNIIYTRLGGGSVDLKTTEYYKGGIGGYPPFDSEGNACGGDIRDWLLSSDDGEAYNLYNVLDDYFEEDIPNIANKFVDNDWYLIIEPFFWYGYYAKDEAAGDVNFTGYWVCGTAPMIAEQENMLNFLYNINSAYGSPYFKRYTNKNFPNCCRFSRSQFGIDILMQGGSIKSMPTNDEIISYGYGIMSFWAGDITVEDIIPPTDTVEDSVKTVNVGRMPEYYTGNRVDGYDVSNSIPEDSIIHNAASALGYYFEEMTVGVRKYTRKYSKPITLYEETVLADGTVTKQAVYRGYINTEASVTFEYLKEMPDIYEFTGMSVRNRVFENGVIEYEDREDFVNSQIVYSYLYTGDTGEDPKSYWAVESNIPGSAHFELPEQDEDVVSAPYEAVINTVTLKKQDRPCTNTYCDGGWIDDWDYCDECGGDGTVSGTDDEECGHCDDGEISTSVQCGSCYGTGLGGTIRCSSCNAQVFETYQICGACGAEGEPGDYECFNCNGNGYTSRSWIDAWTEYVPDLPCGVCDATGYDDGELCYLCGGVGNAGTPHYHKGEWAYNTCGTCDGTKTVFMCPETNCHGDGDNFTEMERCSNCGNDETTNDCEDCEGKGFVPDTISCSTCGGDGIITTSVTEECGYCDDGYVDCSYSCGTCGGDGIIQAGSSAIGEGNRYFTADEIMAAVKEQAVIVAEYVNLNSNVRNDALLLDDNGNMVYFMSDEPVEGAEIKTGLDGSVFTGRANAGETGSEYTEGSGTAAGVVVLDGGNASESQYGAEKCVQTAEAPSVITMSADVCVSDSFGMGSAPTGIEMHYEHAVMGYDVELFAGKAVFGDTGEADSIYNHVLEGWRGAWHNGGDPDDGYHIVVAEDPVEVTTTPEPSTTPAPTTTPGATTTAPGETTPGSTTTPEETTTPAPEIITPVNYLDIVDYNFTRQTRPSSQLVDVVEDAEYYLTLDGSYYLLLAEDIEHNKHVSSKEMQFPFDVYYDGTYYKTDASGYTEWIGINAPGNYRDVWDEGVSIADYESNNHWYVMPVYIPSWAEETDSSGALTYVRIKARFTNGAELVEEAAVQLSGILYGFTVTGINDTYRYYGWFNDDRPRMEFNYAAAQFKLEWRVGARNRIGGEYVRYLTDGTITDTVEDYQTLPIRKGSGDGTRYAKKGDGELAAGTPFGFVIKSISGMNGENDYIEIVPHFKYLLPDGTVIPEEDLFILYDYSYEKYYVVGSESEKAFFEELTDYSDDRIDHLSDYLSGKFSSAWAPTLGHKRFIEAFYDEADTTSYRYGDWVAYTADKYNSIPGLRKLKVEKYMECQYFTNLMGFAKIPSQMRLLSGEFEQLAVNLDKEGEDLITCMDYNRDGVRDTGYDEDSFRSSMQTWYGQYSTALEMYVVNKRLHPDFWTIGVPVSLGHDERIMRIGKLIVGFEINAYKDGVKHLTYGDMWETEGQKRYTVGEYIPNTTDIHEKDGYFPYSQILPENLDNLLIDYGDVAVVAVYDDLLDNYHAYGILFID